MFSLHDAQKKAIEICGDEFPFVYTELTLRIWSNNGIISRITEKNGEVICPDMIIIEILTAISLKRDYELGEIAEARNYLDLKGNIDDKVSAQSLIRFINRQIIFLERKSFTKYSIEKINSTKKIRDFVEQLFLENKKIEIINKYFSEFLRAKKETKNMLR